MMKNLGMLLAVLVLAGCHGAPPPPPPPAAVPKAGGLAYGIDLPRDARDVAMELKSSHLDFVARYYRQPDSRWPSLSAGEAQLLSSEGFRVVAVFESHSRRPDYFSYASGYYDGMSAYAQARGVGQPPGSAIYFAVDYNAQQPDIVGPIDRYFRGVAAGMLAAARHPPEYRIGVYGSGAVCAYLKWARLAQYAWLSNSTKWAGYDGFADWDIRQQTYFPSLSFSQDANEARGDYGGFQVTGKFSSL